MDAKKIQFKDSIISIKSDIDISFAESSIVRIRQELDRYILSNPDFTSSLEPIEANSSAPESVTIMCRAAELAGVGPLAAVAGTVSELIVNESIKRGASWVIVENGGDICLYGDHDFRISLYAGDSPLSGKIVFSLNPGRIMYGVCSSSATVGHSISFGEADSVTVFARSTSLADAAATSIANIVRGENAIDAGLRKSGEFLKKGIDGVFIVRGLDLGRIGKIPNIERI
jgi:uncharacterized protein